MNIFKNLSLEIYAIVLIFAIPSFYLFRFLTRKIQSKSARIFIIVSSTALFAPLLYVGTILSVFKLASYHQSHNFNGERWMNDKENRYRLTEDIIERKILIGKTKKEIKKLLGTDANNENSNQWNYYLGFKPGLFSIDPDVLRITFKNGRVVSVSQYNS